MIKFFRKIRQRLLTENKFSKYLLYAIGEIVLVMIGILLALQVNTWKNDRTNNSLRQEYLKSLKIELQADLKNWGEVRKTNDTIIEVIQNILIDLEVEDSQATDLQTSLNLHRAMESQPISSQNSTYTDLVSSGNMALITPFEIRQKLITHYKSVDQFLTHTQREYDYIWDEFHPFFNNQGYYDWNAGIKSSSNDTLALYRTFLREPKGSRPYKAMENNINFRRVILYSQNNMLDRMLSSTQQMEEEIKKPLSSQ